jgi:hypothetical protein
MRIVQSGQLLYLHGKHIETDELHEKTQKAYLHGENQILRSVTMTPPMEKKPSKGSDGMMSSRLSQDTMDRAQQLRSGTFLSEAVLWTLWEHCGDLSAAEIGSACLVGPKALMDVLIQHPEVHWLSILYARQFLINLNKNAMSDVFEPPDVHQWEPEAIDAGADEEVDLPFKDELPPHISAAVVWAGMVLAQDVARNGLDENRPHHGFTVIIGNARALERCGRSGFNPFHGHDLSVLSPGVTDLLRRNAFHTDGAIAIDGLTGRVIASGWFVADISLGGSEGGARSRSAKAAAQQANGCYVIKCSEDSRGKLVVHLHKNTEIFNSTIKGKMQEQ